MYAFLLIYVIRLCSTVVVVHDDHPDDFVFARSPPAPAPPAAPTPATAAAAPKYGRSPSTPTPAPTVPAPARSPPAAPAAAPPPPATAPTALPLPRVRHILQLLRNLLSRLLQDSNQLRRRVRVIPRGSGGS